ncbi:MAG TPA: 30S ribosome-binding factor RbfA [Roseiflexaceae bacterium]|jgi:ribosome-binding factor A|nr:30S ribosome-binding factor RbfA [Roseiflexaceae bacterium]
MSKRTQQIGEEMLRILSETIQYEMSDPRVGFATVVNVEVSGDLQHARVYVSVMGDEEQQRETMAALEHARGFLRRQVAQELNHLRTVPDLSFKLDTSLAYSQRIGELLRQVEEERGQGNQPDSEGAPRDE